MKIIVGDICYPKSEALIIPANTKGIMSKGIPEKIVKAWLSGISKEVKQFISNNKIEIGGYFISGPGRLSRRGLKKIYHVAIKRLQGDFTSIYIVEKALKKVLKAVVSDKMKSVTIGGLGIEEGELDKKTVARITVENCNRYDSRIDISIIDDNKEFIKEVNVFLKELNNVSTE